MFCYLVPKYSLHQTLRCLKKKKSLLVTYIPSYVPNTIIFLSHSCSCLFHLLPSLHVKFCSLLRVTNMACVTINIIPTKLCHTIVSQLLKICCEQYLNWVYNVDNANYLFQVLKFANQNSYLTQTEKNHFSSVLKQKKP